MRKHNEPVFTHTRRYRGRADRYVNLENPCIRTFASSEGVLPRYEVRVVSIVTFAIPQLDRSFQ